MQEDSWAFSLSSELIIKVIVVYWGLFFFIYGLRSTIEKAQSL